MFASPSEELIRRFPVNGKQAVIQNQALTITPAIPANNTCQNSGAYLFDDLASSSAVLKLGRGSEIITQGATAEYCFQVIDGCVRTVRRLEDGRRQIGEFLLPGDIFGWEAIGEHEFAAEAVTAVTLRRLRLSAVERRADEDRAFAQRLRRYVTEQIKAARSRLVVLGRLRAAERIAAFLLEMNKRLGDDGSAVVELPMCRTDMADYLGLTIETVSRGLTELRRRGAITVKGAWIVIRDQDALDLEGAEYLH